MLLEKASNLWRSMIFGAAGLISFLLLLRVFTPFTDIPSLLSIPLFGVGYFVVIFFIILIHELGHAAAARLMNWDIREIVVGALIYRPPTNTWLWDFYRENSTDAEDLGGWVVAIPPKRDGYLVGDAILILGGPLATFICGSWLIYVGSQPDIITTDWADFFFGLGWLFYVDAIVNLIPSQQNGRARSDGMQLWDLIFSKRENIASRFNAEAVWRIGARLTDGKTIENSDIDLLSRLVGSGVQLDEFSLQVALSSFYQTGHLSEARATLEQLRTLNGTLTDVQKVELAFCLAILDRDVDGAESLLADLQPDTDRTSIGFLRAQATIDYLAGRQQSAEDAIAVLRENGNPGFDADDEALFAAILSKIELPQFGTMD